MLYKIMVKTKTAPECIEPDLYFTYAVDAKDAKRIVSENLDMRDFRITGQSRQSYGKLLQKVLL